MSAPAFSLATDGAVADRAIAGIIVANPAVAAPTATSQPAVAFVCRLAERDAEREGYHALRRAIFCEEQRVFEHDDQDRHDEQAVPLICLAVRPGQPEVVAGVVRIYRAGDGYPADTWFGGRLGAAAEFRTAGVVGRALVKAAVGTAVAWGCRQFLATVQAQNEPFFRRLRWNTREQMVLQGRPHVLMEADLRHYPAVFHPGGPAAAAREANGVTV